MSITTVTTIHCDHKNGSACKNELTLTDASKRSLKINARKEGWLVRGAKLHLCAEHRPAKEAKPKKEKAPKGKASKAPVASKKPAGRPAPFNKKPNGSATPFTAGQSIGKLAKSAKVEAAPAAE